MTIKKSMLIGICVLLIVSNTSIALGAQRFSDVDNSHWANSFINRIAEEGITGGFPDSTFRPSNSVTRIQAIAMIYRMVDKVEGIDNIDDLVFKHRGVLRPNGEIVFAQWAERAIAYALEYEIIIPREISSFMSNGREATATRSDVARYLARALNNEKKYNLVSAIPYIDFELINPNDIRYIDYLLSKEILNRRGDGEGRFNPNNNISRAEIAALISRSMDFLNQKPKEKDDEIKAPNEEGKEIELSTKKGTIEFIDSSSILIRFEDGRTRLFEKNDKLEVLINGFKVNFTELRLSQEIMATLENGERLVKITGSNFVPDVKGIFIAVTPNVGFDLVVLRNLSTDKTVTLRSTSSTKVQLDGKEVTLDKIKSGDKLELKLDGQNIEILVATSKTIVYQGILQERVESLTKPILKVMVNNEVKEFDFKRDAIVVRNGGRSSLVSLRKGDIVVITTEYGEGIKIQANSVITRKTGRIDSITITRDKKSLTILSNREEHTFDVSKDISITVNNVTKSIYDLRLDQIIEITLENDEIIAIASRDDLNQKQITGSIDSIYRITSTSGEIVVDYLDRDSQEFKHIIIYYNRDTRFTSSKLQAPINVANIRANNQVIVVGQEKENRFVADRVILID